MQQPKVHIIVAIAENFAIGKNNEMLWHLPNDFKHFKAITTGHTVLMGRKTFDSIGKALPNRRNIIISRNQNLKIEGVERAKSIADALDMCAGEAEIFVIGGAEIYKQSLHLCEKIYLTTVHEAFQADTFFPNIDFNQWVTLTENRNEVDERHAYAYTFRTLQRKI